MSEPLKERLGYLFGFILCAFLVCGGLDDAYHPGPNPPDPTPIVVPSPFPAETLKVAIFESQEIRHTLPPKQLNVIAGQEVRKYVASVGGDYRLIDTPIEVENDLDWVKQAAKVELKELPAIVIAGPKGGTSERLPNSVEDTLALLKKYGG